MLMWRGQSFVTGSGGPDLGGFNALTLSTALLMSTCTGKAACCETCVPDCPKVQK